VIIWLVSLSAAQEIKLQPFPLDVYPSRGGSSPERFAAVITDVANTISGSYHFEEIAPVALAGRALLGLYRAGNIEPPEALARDTDHYLETQPGDKLQDKLLRARQAMGDVALIQGERGIHLSLLALFKTLDTFSNYAEVDSSVRNQMENGCGIGLHLEDKPLGGSYFVRHVEPESPAHKQGVRPGDELLEIDQIPIVPSAPTSRVNMMLTLSARKRNGVAITLRNLEGTRKKVEISSGRHQLEANEIIIQGNDLDRDTSLTGYRHLQDDDWNYWVDHPNRIALVRVGIIAQSSYRLSDIVKRLRDDGMKGLILDLRDSPVGYPEAAAEMAGLFLEKDALISTTNYRKPNTEETQLPLGNSKNEIRARDQGKRYQEIPLAVLIGPETSGAAEMIASALQDHKRAKMVGQRSRGKSTIQQVKTPNNVLNSMGINFSYRLTVGVFSRPSGKSLNRLPGMTANDDWGVQPDVEVVLPAQVRRQVRAWWFEHHLRPDDSNDPTRIDDMRNDPVLNAAVKLLRKS
jgi:carboxyl-terminal processing protease